MLNNPQPLQEPLISSVGSAQGLGNPKNLETDNFPGLRWTNIGLKVGKNENRKTILKECYGQVKKGELLGIVGSSGSGKTSLLNLLAHRLDPTYLASGDVTFEGTTIKSKKTMKKISSFVSQHDTFHPNLTPRSMFGLLQKFFSS